MRRDAREHITEPGERLNGIALAHRDEAQQHGRRLAAPVAAEERPVVPAHRKAPQSPLGVVVIDLEVAILTVTVQRGPVVQCVPDRPPFRTLWKHLWLDLQQIPIEGVCKVQ